MVAAFDDIAEALQEVWPAGDVASVEEIESRLAGRWPAKLVEAAIWKLVGDSAAAGHLLVDLKQRTLDRRLDLVLLPPEAPPLVPHSLPDTLLPEPNVVPPTISLAPSRPIPGPTFGASTLDEKRRDQFHRNLRAVEQVIAGAPQTRIAEESGIPRTTLSRLVRRTKQLGQIACVPLGTYARKTTMHSAFQECIRRLYLLPTRLSMTAIHEHTEMRQVAAQLEASQGSPVKLPSYDQVRREVHRLRNDPALVAVREGAKSVPRARESAESFVLSIPSPALLAQVDEHSLELYVVAPGGITVTKRVHAAVLVCVKTAAILGAVLSLGPMKEEDYMRLVKMALEPKDELVVRAGCQHAWPCYGKPAIIFHDRGKIFTSERARQVLVDRLGIIGVKIWNQWAGELRPHQSLIPIQLLTRSFLTLLLLEQPLEPVGGWHGSWCWQKVIPFLEAAGHEVYAPTLTGLAERAAELSPDIGLDTHIQDVVGLLQEKNLHGVILVGHSYGGMVITGVVDAVPERIAHLVYLDTFVPRDGEAMVDVSPLVIRLLLRKQAHGGWLESRVSWHLRGDDRARSKLGAQIGDATTPQDVGATASSEESSHRGSCTPYAY